MEANDYGIEGHYMASSLQFSFSNSVSVLTKKFQKKTGVLESSWDNLSKVASSKIYVKWKSHSTIHLVDLNISSNFLKHLWATLASTSEWDKRERLPSHLWNSLRTMLTYNPGLNTWWWWVTKTENTNVEIKIIKTAVNAAKMLTFNEPGS